MTSPETGAPYSEPVRRAGPPRGGEAALSPERAPGPVARIWRSERPEVAIPRDVILVLSFLVLVIGSIWAFSGQPFPSQPPLVVVESGSMMHPDAPYGRVGTIDAGDLVVVRDVPAPDGIRTAYDPEDRTGYGGYGDVIVFRPRGDLSVVPIIHRAITWVDVHVVETGAGEERLYSYWNAEGEYVSGASSLDIPEVGIMDMRPPASGFVTKGDNPRTNPSADQIHHVPGLLVEADWVIGAARGEIPWLGLVKLAISGNDRPPDPAGHCLILRGWGPCDAWLMLGLALAIVVLVPVGLEALHRRSERLQGWME